MSIIPFNPPHLLTAERKAGFVDVCPSSVSSLASARTPSGRGWDTFGSMDNDMASGAAAKTVEDEDSPLAPTLQRTQTMSGNILTITGEDDSSQVAFWLQRKLGKFHDDGMIRLGYQLQPDSKMGDGKWELCTDADSDAAAAGGHHHHNGGMVKIHILPSRILEDVGDVPAAANVYSPVNELSALQMIASTVGENTSKHVVGAKLIATSSQDVYAILPYHQDGTLLQFCQTVGNLPESLARCLFRQIVQGLKTLQDTGLCHRNLSLDAMGLDKDHVDICQLGWALRFDKKAPADEDRPLPPPGGLDPHYIAPEYFGSVRGVWNGFSADLWATGLMLFSMVVGTGALFTAPIAEDKSFHRMCIRGDIRGQASRYGKLTGKDFSGLSDELFDLLRNMLRADPKQRLSLEQVMEHPWLTKDDVMTPTEWNEQH